MFKALTIGSAFVALFAVLPVVAAGGTSCSERLLGWPPSSWSDYLDRRALEIDAASVQDRPFLLAQFPDKNVAGPPESQALGAREFAPRFAPTYSSLRQNRLRLRFPIQKLSATKYRFAVREMQFRGDLVISTIDTYVADAIDKTGRAVQYTEEMMAAGRKAQRQWLEEMLAVIYPDYVTRRKWPESFIAHDFEKALATLNLTRYIHVQQLAEGASDWNTGKTIAILGLNRAPYGVVRWQTGKDQAWKERVAGFGASFAEDELTRGVDLSKSAPILGMENYLEVLLPRPWTVNRIVPSSHPNSSIYFGTGIIYEPVKFFVVRKDSLRGLGYAELVAAILSSVFPDSRDFSYSLSAQYLYTFNPEQEGKGLYQDQGFEIDPNFQPILKDGVAWRIFRASPQSFLVNFHPKGTVIKSEQELQARKVVEALQRNAERFAQGSPIHP